METKFPKAPFQPIQLSPVYGPALDTKQSGVKPNVNVEHLPSGFATLGKAQKLSVEVLQVIERIAQLKVGVLPPGLSISCGESTTANFWSACPSLTTKTPPHEEPDIDNLLALSLWLYVALEFSSRPIAESMILWISMARSTRQDLSTKLMRCIVPRDENEEECLIWIFEIAIASWTGPDGALLPQGLALLSVRMWRFKNPTCDFDKFFEFSKTWSGPRVMI